MEKTVQNVQIGKTCVYAHIHNGEVVYIGRGTPERPYNFIDRSSRWLNFFKGKAEIKVRILKWFSNEKEALKFERKMTEAYEPTCNVQNTKNKREQRGRVTKPKTKVFSISFSDDDTTEVNRYIENLEDLHGFTVSRNELIRRAILAHVRFMKETGNKKYSEVFKGTV